MINSTKSSNLPPYGIIKLIDNVRNFHLNIRNLLTPPPLFILETLNGLISNKLLGIAVELEIADHLKDNPLTLQELSKKLNCDINSLGRILNLLIPIGFFKKLKNGEYTNNFRSKFLLKDHPNSMCSSVLFFSSEIHWDSIKKLIFTVKDGDVAFKKAHNLSWIDYLQKHPEEGKLFNNAMESSSIINAKLIASSYNFSEVKVVCDVGGGKGTVIVEILKKYPKLRGILFDLPGVKNEAEENLKKHNLFDRCSFIGGSFFEKIPEDCDLYILQQVLHDWDDEKSINILKNIRSVMKDKSKLLVVGFIIPEDNKLHFSKFVDILMLTIGGVERTKSQYMSIYKKTGLKFIRSYGLPTHFHVMVLEKANKTLRQ